MTKEYKNSILEIRKETSKEGMSNFKNIYRELTQRAYWENKAAKSLDPKMYRQKSKRILECLKEIKKNKISSISYAIERQETAYSVIFTFHKKDVQVKQAKFHMPLYYEKELKKYYE